MKIKNISKQVVILAGVKIQVSQVIDITALGEDFKFAEYEDEIQNFININMLVFIDSDTGNEITDIIAIRIALEELYVEDAGIILKAAPDFYYNYKQVDLKYGESIQVEFIGYLKSINAFARLGNVELQIVEPLMNKVKVTETSNYEIDADYKLLNPIIKITAKSNAIIELYMDGVFKHDTKTKNQYLKEIYSNSYFPQTDIKKGGLLFKCNFKKTITNNIVRDAISNSVGQTYNNGTLLNFNKFEDGAYVKFGDVVKPRTGDNFTVNLWFKSFGSLYSKQYIMYKRYFFELYVEKSVLKMVIDGYRIDLGIINEDSYYMITASYDAVSQTTHFYLNNELVGKMIRNHTFTSSSQSLYFGSRSGSYTIRSGELGEFNFYNHHFSTGMINNLYLNNHPDHQFKSLQNNCYKEEYICNTSLNLIDTYSANIIKKEFARAENLVLASKSTLDNTTISSNLIVHSGSIYFPEDGKYTFNATFNELIFTIDGKDVLINEGTKTYYIEEGYYKFEVTSFGVFHITYGLKGLAQTEIPVFNNDDIEYILNLDTQTGATFSGVSDLIYNDKNKFTKVENLSDDFFSSSFTINLDFKKEDDEAEIFAQGKLYNEYIALLLQNDKLVLIYRDTYIETKSIKDGFNNIQITANGSKVFLYLNGSLIQSANIYNYNYIKTQPLYFGKSGEGKSRTWLQGNFTLKNVKIYKTYSTPAEIQGRL